MKLTITYKNGEFSCTFTPGDEGDGSVQMSGDSAVAVNANDEKPEGSQLGLLEAAEECSDTSEDWPDGLDRKFEEHDLDLDQLLSTVGAHKDSQSEIYLGNYRRLRDPSR